MKQMNFALLGAGYWARYQLAAWQEISGVRCVAVCDPVPSSGVTLAESFDVPSVYTDPYAALSREDLDFVDIVATNNAHPHLVKMCAERGLPVICQKPMAATFAECVEMVKTCRAAGVPFLIHENWRWQTPIRALRRELVTAAIGRPVRANVSVITGVDDLANQPFLKELERMALTDMGVHLLDAIRFLFGEAETVYCQTARVRTDIKGEDVASIMLRMRNAMTVICQLGFAQIPVERDFYIQTSILVECERGSVELAPDYWVRITDASGTRANRYPPAHYSWGDPAIEVCMASIVDCHRDLLAALRGEHAAETTAEDNLRTMRLMEACYESAATCSANAV